MTKIILGLGHSSLVPTRNRRGAIDLLSYGTLELLSGRDWRRENCLFLAGIYKPKKDIEESTQPAALMQYLKVSPQITEIALHLDNDAAGRAADGGDFKALLPFTYTITESRPSVGRITTTI